MNDSVRTPTPIGASVRERAGTAGAVPAARTRTRRGPSRSARGQWVAWGFLVSRNSILTISLFAFLWSWSDFIFASTLDQGGAHQPITLGIYHYIGNNNQQWNAIMATAVVASIPATILLVIAQRYISAGLTAGAVKD